jgi:hypothetical protein
MKEEKFKCSNMRSRSSSGVYSFDGNRGRFLQVSEIELL